MDFVLVDYSGKKITMAFVESIEEARDLWVRIHENVGFQSNLAGFEVVMEKDVLYKGSYVTDEC